MSKWVADSGGRIPYDAALRQGNKGDASMVTRLRIWVAILAAALVAGACGAGAATPGPTTAGPVAADPVGFSATTGPMSAHRSLHTATLLHSGKVLIAGGADTGGVLSSAELYDPSTDSFTATGSMSHPRAGHTATLLANGKVLIAGGQVGQYDDNTASAELYDPATGSFAGTGAMSHPRSGHTATLLADGRVLIVGGASAYAPADLSSAELYDPDTGTFKPTGSMTSPRDGSTATLLSTGKVLLTGGIAGASVAASAELYDPATGSFGSTGSMSSPRWAHTATLLASGKVLIVGGSTFNTQGDFLASAELYDPATGSFSPTGSMPGPRIGHTATLMTSGKVLIAGGVGAPFESDLASAELYDPATGSFSPIGSMTMVRSGYTATLLQSGRVLIAGGDSNGTVAWAELSVGPSANQPMPTGSPEASASPTNAAFSTRSPRASASPTSGVPMAIGSIDWQMGEQLPSWGLGLQGVVALDDQVLAFGTTHIPGRDVGYDVGAFWSSTDGLTWTLVTGPDAFSKVGSSILNVSSDGHGGLLAAGFVYSDNENYIRDAVWHSSDGLAWTPVDLGSPEGGSGFRVAANSRIAVVEGTVWVPDRWRRYVWSSTDGVSWSSTELPSADNSQPGRAPLLAGGAAGFEILETGYGGVPGHAWHSDDGRTWVETQPPALEGADVAMSDPTSLMATDAGFVAVGVEGGSESAKPAAWATVDGKTWTKSVMEDPGDRFGCKQICRPSVVTQAGSSLIAVGYAKEDPSVDITPPAAVVVWASEDGGRTWRLQGTGPAGLVPAAAATVHSEPIVLDAWQTMRSYRGSIVWKPVAAAGGS